MMINENEEIKSTKKTVSFINEDGKEVIILDFNSLSEKHKKEIDKFFDTYCSLDFREM